MKNFRSFAFAACVLTLSACNTVDGFVEKVRYADWGSTGKNALSSENLLSDGCPQASIVPELARYNTFTDERKPTAASLISGAQIRTIESKCQYGPQSVTVDIKLAFDGHLGPAARTLGPSPSLAYPYFVAVTSPSGTILAKEVFAANMNYAGQPSQTYTESMRQIIPIPSKTAGEQFKVLAGFQLSEDQLRHNRAVIAAEEAARIKREELEKQRAEAAKKNAKRSGNSGIGSLFD